MNRSQPANGIHVLGNSDSTPWFHNHLCLCPIYWKENSKRASRSKEGSESFYWYSFTIHAFLIKNVIYFAQFMPLERVLHGEPTPI